MKTCKIDNCNYPVFSHGYCRAHGYLRTDKKKPRTIRKKAAVKITKGPSQIELFLHIYRKNKHNWISQLSGKPLPHEDESFFIHSFAHILPKGLYKKFKFYEENIYLLTKEEHHLFDFGTNEQRDLYAIRNKCSWSKLYIKVDQLRIQYINYVRT